MNLKEVTGQLKQQKIIW